MENPIDQKLIGDLKRASQEIEGIEEIQPSAPEISKEKPVEVSKELGDESKDSSSPFAKARVGKDLENHLSEIAEARKRLTEERNKIQSRLQLIINLENRIRRVLSERKKIDEDLGKMKNTENF